MKNFYFTLIFLLFGLLVFGQTSPTGGSTEVGVTNGELSVSLSGAANYSIPLVLPPGIKGVVPQISLAYNSQGGYGLAGYGWNVMGISAITRIPSTMYHDGTIDPVDFNSLDRFALDDRRLILKSTEKYDFSATKKVYETEIFSNLKITYHSGYVQNNSQDITLSRIDYFIVEYPDGSSAKYENHGSAADWTISHWQNPQGIFIDYEYNSQYSGSTSPSSNSSIEKIKYGSLKSSSTQINEVQFVYKPRQRIEQAYVGGKSFMRDKVLSAINIKGNGLGFKSYSLKHDTSSLGYERLISVTEKSGDETKSYNPTVFSYEESIVKTGVTKIDPVYISDAGNGFNYVPTTTVGDFDGDGDLDFIDEYALYTKIYDDGSQPVKTNLPTSNLNFGDHFKIFGIKCVEKKSDEFKLMNRDAWCMQYFNKINDVYTGKFVVYSLNLEDKKVKTEYTKQIVIPNNPWLQNITSFSGDFNGDGLTDIIVIKNDYTGINYDGNSLHKANLFFVNLDRRIESDYVKDLGFVENVHQYEKFIQTGDVNGDGKTDLIFFRGGTENSIIVYTLDNNENLVKLWETKYPFVHSTSQGKDVIFYENLLPGYNYPVLNGDFNGDGKTDFILPGLEREMLLSTGNSFVREPLPTSFVASHDIGTILSADFNNDGKTDVLNLKSNQIRNLQPLSEVTLTIDCLTRSSPSTWASSKDTFSNLNAYFYTRINPIMVKPSKVFNGKPELLLYEVETVLGYTNGVATKSYIKAYKVGFFVKNDALTSGVKNIKSITTGNGVKESITYASLINANGVYTAAPQIEYFPNIDIKAFSGFQVVSKLEKQSKNTYKKRLFSYYGGVTNAEGLGFLGFKSTVQTNWHDDSSPIISSISRYDMSLRGANVENYTVLGLHDPLFESPNQIPTRIIKKDDYIVTDADNLVATQSIILRPNTWIKSGSVFSAKINNELTQVSINEPATFITKTLLTYENNLFSDKVFKIKNTSKKQFNGLEGTTNETNTDYDEYNNAKKITTVVKEGGKKIQTSITDFLYDAPINSPHIIGRPSSKIQNTVVETDKMTNEELYYYNSNQLLSQIKRKGDETTNYVTEDNLYDNFGNITKKTLTAGADSRETNYEYDASGRFLSKNIDVEKRATVFEYNTNGTLKSKMNPFGQTTLYEYDAWCMKTKETDYLGNKVDYKYLNSLGNTIVIKIGSDGSHLEETFDDLGRKVKTGIKNIMGTFTYISYLYDIEDRNYKTSEPYFGATPLLWNGTEYDDYGRIIKTVTATAKTTDISYFGLTSRINDGTKIETYVKDAIGKVIFMSDVPANEIKYTYFANGNLKKSDYGGVETIFSQDGWGRKVRLEDSSAGTYIYDYNDFGEVTREITPNGVTNYILDASGKITQKIVSGINTNSKTTYEYNSFNKLLVKSKFEDLTNGTNTIQIDYTYDTSQRINKKTETTPYAMFTKDFKYDSFGRVDNETLTASRSGKSSAKTIKHTYKNGVQYQILDNSTNAILWQNNTVNARGQLLSALSGPVAITNTYDNYGYASQFKYDKSGAFSNILILNINFDIKKGNLENRANSLFAWNESFEYDNFDRLIGYNNVHGVKEVQAYDEKGRITQNSLGIYSYSKDKPYQNTAISITSDALTYYTTKPSQVISYNSFKSPILIDEKGVDKISFDYNDDNNRTAMFYGDLQDDKLKRLYRKYYAGDGSMEIKENEITGALDFVTYIGGDGYSAPVVFKSDGLSSQKYLYLQRDYQNSIVAITDQTGAVIEKRLFDAWGGILKVQDGLGNELSQLTVLDRGYTGHEHMHSIGIINMNGRLYDSKLHRFLQPDNNIQDPFNTQNFNRYGYVLNNPLKYTDPSGESILELGFGLLFSIYAHGGAASGGEINFFKWNANAWTSAFAGAASSAGSYYASGLVTGVTNNYLVNYNSKPALGASAINNNMDFNYGYIGITPIELNGKEISDSVVPCVTCHHNLDRGEVFESELFQPQSRFGNGLKNTTFGLVSAFGSTVYMIKTGGVGAAVGGSTALTLSLGSVSIGLAQMVDSFDDSPKADLHSISTIPGYIASRYQSPYTPLIDGMSSWATGSFSGGNIKGVYESSHKIYNNKDVIFNSLNIYNTWLSGSSYKDAIMDMYYDQYNKK